MPDFNAVSPQINIARRWFLKDCGVRRGAAAASSVGLRWFRAETTVVIITRMHSQYQWLV